MEDYAKELNELAQLTRDLISWQDRYVSGQTNHNRRGLAGAQQAASRKIQSLQDAQIIKLRSPGRDLQSGLFNG